MDASAGDARAMECAAALDVPNRRSRNQEGCRGSRLQTPGFR
jgi:hypothetical protein